MGVLKIESFDYYATSALQTNWNGTTLSNATISSSAARNGTQGLRIACGSTSSSGGFIASSSIGTNTTVYMGFALRLNELPNGDSSICFFSDSTGATDAGIEIQVTSTGQLRIFVDNSVTDRDNWTGTSLTTGTWYYVEVKCKATASSATGDVEVKVDYGSGPTVVNQITSGWQTFKHTANIMFVGFGSPTNRCNWPTSTNAFDIDDVYILSATGGVNTGYLGNCKVDAVYPNGAGASTQWTPLTGNNYAEVSELIMDGNTSYVSTTGTGNRDSYTLAGLTSTPTSIYAVQAVTYAEDDTGGSSHTISNSLRIASTYNDATALTVNANVYRPYMSVWENNPSTSAAFTKSDIAGMEAGVKLVS